jgi:topoisomerase-4 subunit B
MMKLDHLNAFTTLMGDKVAPRREWIESHVEFGLQEDQSILDNSEIQILEHDEQEEEEIN